MIKFTIIFAIIIFSIENTLTFKNVSIIIGCQYQNLNSKQNLTERNNKNYLSVENITTSYKIISHNINNKEEITTKTMTNIQKKISTDGLKQKFSKSVHFLSIEPTVMFIKKNEKLLQLVKIKIVNLLKSTDYQLQVKIGNWEELITLNKVKLGDSVFNIYVPDIKKSSLVEFILKKDSEILDRKEMIWQPQRHWEVYLVPISHHDLGFTDEIENILKKHDTFYDDVLRFCEETNDFPEDSKYRYTAEQTWSIKHFIDNRPKDIIDKLKKYIDQGRIETHAFLGNEITGLCGHEELIRLMYPAFRLKREYGITVEVASITDIPGLSWGIPTILAGAGIKYFYGGMPNYGIFFKNDEAAYFLDKNGQDIHQFWDESKVLPHGRQPEAFRWEGPDGKSVLFYYGSTGNVGCYGCWCPESYEDALKNLPPKLISMESNGSKFSIVRYGTFGCYDNEPPDIRPSLIAREWNNRWAYPRLIIATSSMFFKELEKQCEGIQTFRGELPCTDYVRGAMSTARETGINRITQDRILSAEKFATLASIVSDFPYPGKKIQQSYEDILSYDEHTWGMADPSGTIQDWNWNDKSHFALRAAGMTEFIINTSLNKIANSIKRDEKGQYITVFNPLSFIRTDIVRLSRFDHQETFEIIDEETGWKVPYQIYKIHSPRALVPYAGQRYAMGQFNSPELFDLVFLAENVPPLGYKTYRLVATEKPIIFSTSLITEENVLENRFFKVLIDPHTGTIESIYDKDLNRELVDKDAIYHINQFVARSSKTLEEKSIEKIKICKGQSGPVYSSIEIWSEGIGCPQITQEIILYDKLKKIDFANRILKDYTPLWEIYFAFPFKIDNPTFRYEGSHSVVEPFVDQFPGSNTCYYAIKHWASISNSDFVITLSPLESHLVEFGGMWPCYISPGMHIGVMPTDKSWINSIPNHFVKGHIYAYVMDSNFRINFSPAQQGDLLFRFSITSHKGDWKPGLARDFGWSYSNPLLAVMYTGKSEGTLPNMYSFLQIDKNNSLLLAFKMAENNEGIIVRLIETEGRQVEVIINFSSISIKKAYLTNLVEENIKEITHDLHKIKVSLDAFGITTIRIQTNE